MERSAQKLTSNHWGIGIVHARNGRITHIDPHPLDPAPSDLDANLAASLTGRARVLRPAIRCGWLAGDGGAGRGRDAFVELSWEAALDLLARELTTLKERHGNESLFAGSYGWASAGRFHHAQSQLKRFLNCFGGFVSSHGNYSYQAALVAMPHIVGGAFRDHLVEATRWDNIAEHADLVVSFGGLAGRNMQICDGGNSRHLLSGALKRCRERGVRFINVSPLRRDMDAALGAAWMPVKPGTDTALMLALCQTLIEEERHDRAFLARYTSGFETVAAYLDGRADGLRKSAQWASAITGLAPDQIRDLARAMAKGRTFITCAASLQRADWGEQPLWACVTLASLLGQIGLPGGGYGIGYAVNGHVGAVERPFRWAALPQGTNPVKTSIPVAMLAEMLLSPGAPYRHDGAEHVLPHARMVWWAGGNPFHHHQDLKRLSRAFKEPDFITVNEINWTATARHADLVLPVAAAAEREDFGAGKSDNVLVPMQKSVAPPGQARTEYAILSALAGRLGLKQAFTEGLSEAGWLKRLWQETRDGAQKAGHALPPWEDFIAGGPLTLDEGRAGQVFLAGFRQDPEAHPRPTPSGKIALFSPVVAGFDLSDCAGHATWNAPRDPAPEGSLALLSGQPGTRLHSQFDNGALSLEAKIGGREPVLINPLDAAAHGIRDGDIVRLSNERGACLAGASVTDDIAPGALFLWTGAWYDPDDKGDCRHGNPNVLTHDERSSDWSQGPAAHSVRVMIARFDETPPEIAAHEPPRFVARDS
ncbi:MAG: molybdopterin-dependent oxidoreductase [Pseudomonadota bacterium]